MTLPLAPVRRVVTGHDALGRSCIIEDGPTPATRGVAQRPGYRSANLWRTGAAPAPVEAADSVLEQRGVTPPSGGTVLRVIDIPPEAADPQLRRAQAEATFAALFDDAERDAGEPLHPGMHRTETIDYAIVLAGELTAILDTGQTLLRAGDILIQRATRHAWANRSGGMVRVAFILVDGRV